MVIRFLGAVCVAFAVFGSSGAQWVKLENLKISQETTELAGPCMVIEYDLNLPEISSQLPAYVFVRYSRDDGATWRLLPHAQLRGNGSDIVEKNGHKEIFWWGVRETQFTEIEKIRFKVRGLQMCRVPGGEFVMKSIPGQGRDESEVRGPSKTLPLYYITRNEITIAMYVDYLNEVGRDGLGWNERMSHPDRCGIERLPDGLYKPLPGRANYPITYVSWYDAVSFLGLCGLRLPTEAEFEKAIRGGTYLDSHGGKQKNPAPERRYPWGSEKPGVGGTYRCNFEGAEDGFEYTAPVGTYLDFASPYGVYDLAGNVAEWTLDWYTTSHHAGLDGFRLVRGGSWMAMPEAVDAISGATQFPIKESSIMGFRGVK